jgi:hypothetical protein
LKNQTRFFSEPEPETVGEKSFSYPNTIDIKPVDTQPETEPLPSLLPAHRAHHMLLKKNKVDNFSDGRAMSLS